jgi:hypothetical protein
MAYLLAQLREDARAARPVVAEAYRRVFASEQGRFVLLHHLLACGVGRRLGPEASDIQLRYSAGMMDSAIMLANDAGYDEAALAASVLTQELPEDERHPPGEPAGVILPDADDGADFD